jgi:hypothetical protein
VTKAETAELAGQLPTMPGPRRCLRIGSAGLLRVDCAAIAVEAKLDGKFLLRGSDPQLSAEDIALGYQQLLHVERGWRDLTAQLELRPRSTTAANSTSAPTCSSAGLPCCWCASSGPVPAAPGRRPRGPDRPGRHLRPGPANPPPPPARCWPRWRSPAEEGPGPGSHPLMGLEGGGTFRCFQRKSAQVPGQPAGRSKIARNGGPAAHVIWCCG